VSGIIETSFDFKTALSDLDSMLETTTLVHLFATI
jgi:hypothetical protein